VASSANLVKVAAVQAAPVFLDKARSIEKACKLIAEAAQNGARLVVFPEVFIPGYPDWVWLIPNSKGKELNELYVQLVENAVSVPDEATAVLCEAARTAGVFVAVGMHERNSDASGSSLFNSLMYIDDQGEIMGVHRKLIPTGGERLVWGQGDGSTLHSFDTPMGKLGGLICWENFMPLARQAMYDAGVQIHLAPTWDKSEGWLIAMRNAAREGGMFVISCCMAIRVDDIPEQYDFRQLYPTGREWINTGNSCIIGPNGRVIAGPMEGEEGILYAELDLQQVTASKRMFDAAGHYARPDVFKFEVKRGGE